MRATNARSNGCAACSTPHRRADVDGDPIERLKSELFADRIYAMTPKGRSRGSAARLDAARFRLPPAYRSRSSLPRRQDQRPHRAAQSAARQRPGGRDHHRQAAALRAATGCPPIRASWLRRAAAPKCARGSAASTSPSTASAGATRLERELKSAGAGAELIAPLVRELKADSAEDLHRMIGEGEISSRGADRQAIARAARAAAAAAGPGTQAAAAAQRRARRSKSKASEICRSRWHAAAARYRRSPSPATSRWDAA